METSVGVAGVAAAQSRRCAERLPMRRLELGQQAHERTQELVERGEADVDLELGARGRHHLEAQIASGRDGSLQQSRLADPRFPRNHQSAAADSRLAEKTPQPLQLDLSPTSMKLPLPQRNRAKGPRLGIMVKTHL